MAWSRRFSAGAAMVLVAATAACSSGGVDAEVVGAPVPAKVCPGEEVGDIPITLDLEHADDPDDEDTFAVAITVSDDDLVYFNTPFSVFCIEDEVLYEVADPDTVPYPPGEEISSYVGIDVSAEGNPLVVDWQNPRVFEIADGESSVVPGSDDPMIGGSRSMAVAPDGAIYVTGLDSSGTNGIYAIADGEARRYAGAGDTDGGTDTGLAGDGGPALASELDEPEGLAVDAEGNLYIADRLNNRVAVVSPDGTIDTLAGGTGFDDRPDSDDIGGVNDLAVDSDGTLFIHDFREGDDIPGFTSIAELDADGTITPVIGGEDASCRPLLHADGDVDSCALGELDASEIFRFDIDSSGTFWMVAGDDVLRVVDGRVEHAVDLDAGL